MQIFPLLKQACRVTWQKIPKTLVLSIIVMACLLICTGQISAQYQRGAYGSCAYGQNCPDDSSNPEDPNDSGSNPTSPPTTNTTTPNDSQDSESNSGSSQQQSLLQPVKGFSGLGRIERFIQQLPTDLQRSLPFIIWLLLLLLALILLLQAYLDKYRTRTLTQAIQHLQDVLAQQKNFIRLVLHHLNTPLASIKSTLELLTSAQPPETNAITVLKPVVLELATTIDYSAMEIMNDSDMSLRDDLTDKSIANIKSVITQWYFVVPIVVAIIGGIYINWILMKIGTERPEFYLLYQFTVAVMVVLIFFNSIRLLRISRERKQAVSMIQRSVEQLQTKRQQAIQALGSSLTSVLMSIHKGVENIQNKKLSSFMITGIATLEAINLKTNALEMNSPSPPESVSCKSMLTEILAKHQLAIEEKNINISTNYNNVMSARINKFETMFIIDAIIENAVIFNIQNGSIDIVLNRKKQNMYIEISDTGIGIPETAKSLLFKPFSQGNDVLTHDYKGYGLSLYVAQQLAQKINASISLESNGRSGAQAKIIIPVKD